MRDVAALAEALAGYIRTHRREQVDALVNSPTELHAFVKAKLGVDDHDARLVLLDLAESMIEIDLRDQADPERSRDPETTSASRGWEIPPATRRTPPWA